MHDPFPIPAPGWMRSVCAPIIAWTGFETLPLHMHEIIFFAAFYHFVCVVVSPAISMALFPNTYKNLPFKTRINWDVHVVSFVQSCSVIYVAFWLMGADKERAAMVDWRERIWGYTGAQGFMTSMATGYFLWDMLMCARYIRIFGPGLLAHAVSALCVYSLGYRPYVNYYAPIFILFELSSPFLNIHWFCDKLDLTGSTIQWVNGIVLLATFFGSRLVWGIYQSICVFSDIFKSVSYASKPACSDWVAGLWEQFSATYIASKTPEAQLFAYKNNLGTAPLWLAGAYLSSNIVLNTLNIFWFGKMISTIRARFDPPFGTKKAHVVMGRAVQEDGAKTVEIASVEVGEKGKKQSGSTGVRSRRA